MSDITVSGTNNPYVVQNYTAEANDKNTLDMVDYFKLLATQLQNQDMTNPMDNSEMMAQMIQMGMMQAMSSMTDAMDASTATTTQTYAASLIGQEVTVMVTEESTTGVEVPIGVKYAKVESVSFVNGVPKLKLEGDNKEYYLSSLVGVGHCKDPFAKPEEDKGDEDGDKVEGPDGDNSGEGGDSTGGTEGVPGAGGTEGSEGTGDGSSTEGDGVGDLPSGDGTTTGGSTGTPEEVPGAGTQPDGTEGTEGSTNQTAPAEVTEAAQQTAAGEEALAESVPDTNSESVEAPEDVEAAQKPSEV